MTDLPCPPFRYPGEAAPPAPPPVVPPAAPKHEPAVPDIEAQVKAVIDRYSAQLQEELSAIVPGAAALPADFRAGK